MAARRNAKATPRPAQKPAAAKQTADKMLAEARDQAESIRSDAEQQAEQLLKEAAARVEAAEATVAELEGQRDAAARELDRVKADTEAEHGAGTRALEMARKRAEQMLAEARQRVESAERQVGQARTDAEAARVDADAVRERAELEAARLRHAATVESDELRQAARTVAVEAEETLAQARRNADAVQAEAEQQHTQAVEQAAQLRELAEAEAKQHIEQAKQIREGAGAETDDAKRQAKVLEERRRDVLATARRWAITVIAISTVITVFGSGNAHDVLSKHHTPEPWGWFLYPALEAGLIVEIQIGGALAALSRPVAFWGAALRVVTALAAVTVCVYGPAENGDVGGAVLHAIGPIVQFWLAEFLAAARKQFKNAADDLTEQAESLLRPALELPAQKASQPSRQRRVSPQPAARKQPETKPKPQAPRRETAAGETDGSKVSPIGDTDRANEIEQLISLMQQRGGTDEVSLDRDVVPLLSHLSRATCDRRLKRAREMYRKSA